MPTTSAQDNLEANDGNDSTKSSQDNVNDDSDDNKYTKGNNKIKGESSSKNKIEIENVGSQFGQNIW